MEVDGIAPGAQEIKEMAEKIAKANGMRAGQSPDPGVVIVVPPHIRD